MSGICAIYCRTSGGDDDSIERQERLGKEFCEKNGFEPAVYEDFNKTGTKPDVLRPFKNRPQMEKLVNDIRSGTIDKIWILDFTRMVRHESNMLWVDLFVDFNITFFDDGKTVDLSDDDVRMMYGFKGTLNKREAAGIKKRINRGRTDALNKGIRGVPALRGYKKSGHKITSLTNGKEKAYTNWVPVESELDKIKSIFENFLNGASMASIANTLSEGLSVKQRRNLVSRHRSIMEKHLYTGFDLNEQGREIRKKFRSHKINSLQELLDTKYWVKSQTFPVELISIEDWVRASEKLRINSNEYTEKERRKVDTIYLATGLISCPYCNDKFHWKNNNNSIVYNHRSNRDCSQSPKSIKIKRLNDLFNFFYFYYYSLYDDTKKLIADSQQAIKDNQQDLKEKLKGLEKDNKSLDKQINNFSLAYEKTNNPDTLLTLIEEKNKLSARKEKSDIAINELQRELEALNNKFHQNSLELTYYDLKEKIVNFFEVFSEAEKRNALVKIINRCQLFKNWLLIDTGSLLFIFDINESYELKKETYEKFKNSDSFKDNFFDSVERPEISNVFKTLLMDYFMEDLPLNANDGSMDYMSKQLSESNIDYPIYDKVKVINGASSLVLLPQYK